jgi:hypothetical protein
MSTLKPYSGRSALRLTSLVNRANKKNLLYGVDFTFGTPRTQLGLEQTNTEVDVVPLRELDKYRTASVAYTRLPISVLELLPLGTLLPVNIYSVPFRIHEVLPRINEALGVNLAPEEVEDALCENVEESYALTIKEGSLAWLPSSIQFTAQHLKDIPLDTFLRIRVLNGLVYNQK